VDSFQKHLVTRGLGMLVLPPSQERAMQTFVIERNIPSIGSASADDMQAISQKSCGVLQEMDHIRWVHSYVTPDKIYCIYEADSPDRVREHARRGGFPADSVEPVVRVISPGTADPRQAA
jgi:hypothetical protein